MDYREPPPHHPQHPNTTIMVPPPASFHNTIMAPATARFPPSFNNNNNINNPSPPHSEPFDTYSEETPKPLVAEESAKRKRGRPRKYSPEGNIALGLAPTPQAPAASSPPSSSAKKSRGRPPGSGKKQLDALGTGGSGFTPHVISVGLGEDVAAKVMAFCEQGPRSVCILAAHGSISNVTLRHPTVGGGNVTYEGQYEIISLSGVFHLPEVNGGRNQTYGLNVVLGACDGRVMGGGVAGKLTAAATVLVIVGSFIAERKKVGSNNLKSGPPSMPPTSQMLGFGGSVTPTSPTSQGPSTDSSDDNENGTFSKGSELYNNVTQPPIHSMPVYHPQLWASQPQL